MMKDGFMNGYRFTEEDYQKIARILQCELVHRADCMRFLLVNEEDQRKLTMEIFPEVEIYHEKTNLITVYTGNSHIQLHRVQGYIPSESLGEVLFVAVSAESVSGLIVAREASCNIYAHVDKKLISTDFTSLAPEMMISGIALSLAEPILQKIQDHADE